jgi:hypothetical protein
VRDEIVKCIEKVLVNNRFDGRQSCFEYLLSKLKGLGDVRWPFASAPYMDTVSWAAISLYNPITDPTKLKIQSSPNLLQAKYVMKRVKPLDLGLYQKLKNIDGGIFVWKYNQVPSPQQR